MRVALSEHGEARDCLAQDWAVFMAGALPDFAWVPVPNLGAKVGEFVRGWGLQGIILSGGNDLGENPLRDLTETTLLSLAEAQGLPVFGVCRGLQVIQQHFGGKLTACPRPAHVGARHAVQFLPTPRPLSGLPERRVVNSFHAQGVKAGELAPDLEPFALSEDGYVEGLAHRRLPIAAVQWHPERFQPFERLDQILLRGLLSTGLGYASDYPGRRARLADARADGEAAKVFD